jgi:hypothetical protein
MKIFLFWLLAIILVIAGYLAFLWWHPAGARTFKFASPRFFALLLIPTVPLIFGGTRHQQPTFFSFPKLKRQCCKPSH